jgi:tRNA nucleotidyltransferase (CCA-adding enzyme)
LSGEEIMLALNIKPGKTVGVVKEAVKEAILNGDIPNEHQAAHQFMLENKNTFLK